MAFETETDAGVDAPVETENNNGINAEDLDLDFNDEEVDEAAKEHPIPKGRHRLRIVDGTIRVCGEKAAAPGRPYFSFTMELADAEPGDDWDKIFEMVFFPWKNEDGTVLRGQFHMKRLQAFETATGIKLAGRNAAEVIEELRGVEFDAKTKIEKGNDKVKRARIDEYC